MKGQQRLLYLLPACILVFAFFLFPLAYLSYISFFEWDGLGPKTFVGFENFEYVFSDPIFRTAVKNTIVWLLSALLLHIPFGLLLALLLNRKPRGAAGGSVWAHNTCGDGCLTFQGNVRQQESDG